MKREKRALPRALAALVHRLVDERRRAPRARIRVMTFVALAIPLSPLAPCVGTVNAVLAVAMLIAFAHMTWLINLSALVVDVIPARSPATAFGVIATGSALGGMTINAAVGQLVTSRSYTAAFLAMACAHPLALLLLRRVRPGAVECGGENSARKSR